MWVQRFDVYDKNYVLRYSQYNTGSNNNNNNNFCLEIASIFASLNIEIAHVQ